MQYEKTIEQIDKVIALLQKELDEGRKNGGANKVLLKRYQEAAKAIIEKDYNNAKIHGSTRMYVDWAGYDSQDDFLLEEMSKAEALLDKKK